MDEKEKREPSTFRYEAIIATLVGVLALGVSAYTAYVQRQQVRAQVWPILEYSTSNIPNLRLSIANKGVGPALIKHVIVTVDGAPIRFWREGLEKLLGPGNRNFSESEIGHRILSAGENVDIFAPTENGGEPLSPGPAGSDGARFNQGRARFGVEVCYCSTLGDCWTLRDVPGTTAATSETSACPAPSANTFQQ